MIGGILCIGLGIYFGFTKSPTASVHSVKISPDKTSTIVVPATTAYGINAVDASTGKQFVVNAGEDIEISVSGNVQVGTDRPVVGPTVKRQDISIPAWIVRIQGTLGSA